MAELEKLGSKYKVALRIARDARFERLPCQHKGTYGRARQQRRPLRLSSVYRYADDCLVDRCTQHRCFIVATCDKVPTVARIALCCSGGRLISEPCACLGPSRLMRLQDLKRRIRKIPGVPIMCPAPAPLQPPPSSTLIPIISPP
jgi:hypothetical protein